MLPGTKSESTKGIQGDIEREVMNEENIDFSDFAIDEISELSSVGMCRPLRQCLNQIKVEYDDDDPVFSFWLNKGTYATSFLREIMKCEDVKAY